MYKGDIPYTSRGNVPHYPIEEYEWEYNGSRYQSWLDIRNQFGEDALRQAKPVKLPQIWKPNVEFFAKLKILDIVKGRSAAYFIVENMETKATYSMFMKDFLDLVQRHAIMMGETNSLKWVFCKRGANYGVKLG